MKATAEPDYLREVGSRDHVPTVEEFPETVGSLFEWRLDLPFLTAAALSLVGSILLWLTVDPMRGIFVGLWVPSILALWVGVRCALLHVTLSSSRNNRRRS